MSDIPGLLNITDENQPDGSCKITLEIEDGKADEFFSAFNLRPDDQEGLQLLLIKAIEDYLIQQGRNINR